MEAPADIHFDGWTLRRKPRELFRDGVRVKLQDMPLHVLELLLSAPGQLVTREQLIAALWPKRVVEFDAALNAAIRRLRAALGDEAETPRYIETIPRQGYRFVGTIEAMREAAAAAPLPVNGAQDPATEPQTPPSEGAPPSSARRRWLLPAALALTAGVIGAWAIFHSTSERRAPVIASGEVEVQRFAAHPPDPAREARAASYAGAFRQRFTELGIPNTAAEVGRHERESEFVLIGELNDVGGKSVLTARLDDRQSGATLWTVRREPTEGAAWESNLAGFALKCALKRRDPKLGPTALSRYIYGCANFLERDFAGMHAVTKQLYEAAPNDPRVIAFYGFAHAGAGWAGSLSKAEEDRFVHEGARLAQLALKLDPHNADALFTMGFSVSDSQFAAQETWWRRAIDADPEAGWALGRYAKFLADVGRIREAIDFGLRAQLYRRVTNSQAPQLLASIGELPAAHAQYTLVRPMDPEAVGRRETLTDVLYGDADATEKKLLEQPSLAGGNQGCWKQILAARRRQPLDAARFAQECGGAGDFSARAFAIAGNIDAAYREMDSLLREEPHYIPQLFWPEMRDFIRDPRFWPLAARIGLVDYWLDSNQWPDFCAEPNLPFDCKVEALKAQRRNERRSAPAQPGT